MLLQSLDLPAQDHRGLQVQQVQQDRKDQQVLQDLRVQLVLLARQDQLVLLAQQAQAYKMSLCLVVCSRISTFARE